MMILDSQCQRCKHKNEGSLTCKAFPEGIPLVMLGTIDQAPFDHRKPFDGDNGVRWEPKSPGVKHPDEGGS